MDGMPPPLNRTRGMARRRADYALQREHGGKCVAYVDHWAGDTLDRQVVLVAAYEEFYDRLEHLDPDLRGRVELWHVPSEDGPLNAPSPSLI